MKNWDQKEGIAINYGNLGIIYFTRGDLDRAEGYYRKSLALFQEIGAKPKIELLQNWLKDLARLKQKAKDK